MVKLVTNRSVVVCGAGMTGLALALALAQAGFEVEVIDPKAMQTDTLEQTIRAALAGEFEPRVSALTRASEQLLKNLQAWEAIAARRAEPYRRMVVWDGETRGEISFSARELHQPCLGHIVENTQIVLALLERAVREPQIRLSFGVKLDRISAASDANQQSDGPVLTLSDGTQRTPALLIGADGALSETRRLAGIGTHEWDYGHHAVVATLCTEQPHQHCCWQRFTEDGPLALLPLKDPAQKRVSLVWSTSPDNAAALQALGETEFCAALTHASRAVLGRICSATGVQVIPLRQRHALHYVDAGVALVGDAAHTIHPLAGQGVNLGFQDVAMLVEVLLAADQRSEFIGSIEVLRRYQRRRLLANTRMSAAMEGFRRLFVPQPAIVEWGRSVGMRLVDQCAPVKQHLMLEAMGLRGDLPALLRLPPS